MVLPQEFLDRMKTLPDYDEFLNSYKSSPYSGFRVNPNKYTGSLFSEYDRVPWCKNGYYADKGAIGGNHPYHMAGLIYFQEPSAMCAAEMLPLDSGDLVLDLCAAPGGKSTQIGANKEIILVSNEIIPKRCSVLSENIERMGYGNTVVTNESPDRLALKYPHTFDKIIIDAPCSGEGMFKKEPAAVTDWSLEHVKSCADRQKKIIESSMEMLKQGGSIVYSTCTFSPEENEGAVKYILENYPYMNLIKSETLYPHRVKGEGHFAALLTDTREKTNSELKTEKYIYPKAETELFKSFEKKYLNTDLQGEFVLFGENLYLMPCRLPISGVKVKRAGLHLGECRKGNFKPAHALAKYLRKQDFKYTADFELNDIRVEKYLRGETLEGDFEGYGAVLCDGLPLGFVKGVGGILKNHFPKGLRLY